LTELGLFLLVLVLGLGLLLLLNSRLRLVGHRGVDNFVLRALFFRELQVGLRYVH